MNRVVIKRDGLEKNFDITCIEEAIKKAAIAAAKEINDFDDIISKITNKLNKEKMTVEEIQEVIEHTLMVSKYKDVAKKFIEYRHERDLARQSKSEWATLGIDIITGADTESQRENSNVPRDTVTTKIEMIKRLYSKKFVNDFILPQKFKEAHNKGIIHIHDLGDNIIKVHNCMLLDYPFMLKNGFQLGNKWIETPSTILTAMNVLVQMVQVESHVQFGGLTLGWIDEHLAEYIYGSFEKYFKDALEDVREYTEQEINQVFECFNIRPDDEKLLADFKKEVDIAIKKTEKEVYKACKLLSYQLNTLQVRGESSPFVTIGYGTATDWAGRLLQKSLLQERIDEFWRSGVQDFPKHLLAVRSGVNLNPEDPNYDIFKQAVAVASKTCYPDFIFPENQEFHTGGSAYYMGCRSLLSPWYDENGNLTYLGRGNSSVVTLNLPRIAIESEGDVDKFFEIMDERLLLCKDVLMWRYNRLISLKAKESPFTYIGGAFGMKLDPEESVEKCFANGRGSASIGYIGLHEVTLALLGTEPYYSKEALELQKKILKHLHETAIKFKNETGVGYSIYSSPSESLTDRFCRIDKATFGEIKGITDKGFYINSYHVNTETPMTPFEKIDIESQLQPYAQGGHVMFVEMQNAKDNPEAYESFIRYAHDKKLMYFAVNSAWDYCKTCHWTGEVKIDEDIDYRYCCPKCGEDDPNNIIITRRLCGYISSFNKRPPVEGRIKEIKSRVKHN